MKQPFFKKNENFWILFNGVEYVVGLTKNAQKELGTITYASLPKENQELQRGDIFLELEAEKAVTEFTSPLSGVVSSVNEKIDMNVSALNTEDELDAWILSFKAVEREEFIAL